MIFDDSWLALVLSFSYVLLGLFGENGVADPSLFFILIYINLAYIELVSVLCLFVDDDLGDPWSTPLLLRPRQVAGLFVFTGVKSSLFIFNIFIYEI